MRDGVQCKGFVGYAAFAGGNNDLVVVAIDAGAVTEDKAPLLIEARFSFVVFMGIREAVHFESTIRDFTGTGKLESRCV